VLNVQKESFTWNWWMGGREGESDKEMEMIPLRNC
jgi:hypothetical protein